jgi:hypothetical protein
MFEGIGFNRLVNAGLAFARGRSLLNWPRGSAALPGTLRTSLNGGNSDKESRAGRGACPTTLAHSSSFGDIERGRDGTPIA